VVAQFSTPSFTASRNIMVLFRAQGDISSSSSANPGVPVRLYFGISVDTTGQQYQLTSDRPLLTSDSWVINTMFYHTSTLSSGAAHTIRMFINPVYPSATTISTFTCNAWDMRVFNVTSVTP
jgi:hypothetical protein